MVSIVRQNNHCRTIRTTLSDNWNHLVGQLEPPPLEGWGKVGASQNVPLPKLSNTRAPSTNWGTLGLPQQTEEHYFTVHSTLYTVHCKIFPLNFSTQLFHLIFPANFCPQFSPRFQIKCSTKLCTLFLKQIVHIFSTTFLSPNISPNCTPTCEPDC